MLSSSSSKKPPPRTSAIASPPGPRCATRGSAFALTLNAAVAVAGLDRDRLVEVSFSLLS